MKLLTVTQADDNRQGTCTIKVDDIRCFYPRRHNQQGTRITFRDGGGFAVLDAFDTIRDTILAKVPVRLIPLTQVREDYGREETIPTLINAEAVRCFYPRHAAKPGTRLTFDDGGGFAVAEPYDHVLAVLAEGGEHAALPQPEPLALGYEEGEFEEEEDEDEEETQH